MSNTVRWAAAPEDDNVTAYEVYKSDSYGGDYELLTTVTGTPPANHYVDVDGESTDWYRVRAQNAFGFGPYGPPIPAGYASTFATLRPGQGWLADFGEDHVDEYDLREAEAVATVRVIEDLIVNYPIETIISWLPDPPPSVRGLSQTYAGLFVCRRYKPSDGDLLEAIEEAYNRDRDMVLARGSVVSGKYTLEVASQDVNYPTTGVEQNRDSWSR